MGEITSKIEGEFEKREDVVITTTEIVQKEETKLWKVGEVERQIARIDSDLIHLAAEKAMLQALLADNEVKITEAVKAETVEIKK